MSPANPALSPMGSRGCVAGLPEDAPPPPKGHTHTNTHTREVFLSLVVHLRSRFLLGGGAP